MKNNENTNNKVKRVAMKYLKLSLATILFAFISLQLWSHLNATPEQKGPTYPHGIRLAKIQDVQVGERSIGKNPQLTGKERSEFLSDPDPAKWRKLTLMMTKSNGKRLDITLLRPLEWLEEVKAEQGGTIYLDLPEMGAQGDAKVLAIDPCPPIMPGKGNIITGTFHHEAGETIDIHVQGLDKPIGCTANHPFWSETRQDFVEAGTLQPQEDLLLYDGQITKVIQILPRPGPERVHNLEVLNEHVYYVENIGVLVHNKYTLTPYGGQGGGHHIFMKSSFEGCNQYNLNTALCLSNAEMSRLKIDHKLVSAKQHELCNHYYNEKTPNSLEIQYEIARQSLIAGGCSPREARKIANEALVQMKDILKSTQQLNILGIKKIHKPSRTF